MRNIFFLSFYLVAFTAAAQSWTAKADFPEQGRGGVVSFVIQDVPYVGLGKTTTGFPTSFYKYDVLSDSWSPVAPFPGVGRRWATAFAIGNKGYVGIGRDSLNTQLKDFWAYDPTTDSWTSVADFADARSSAVAFVINGKAYVGTGNSTTGLTNSFYKYDPTLNTWQSIGNAPISARVSASSFVINGKGYVVAGQGNNSLQESDVQEFDPATNTWTERIFATYLLSAYRANSFVLNNEAYICYGTVRRIVKYNPVTNAVTDLGNPLGLEEFMGRVDAACFAVGGKGYFGLGSPSGPGASGEENDLWQYAPTSSTTDAAVLPATNLLLPTGDPNAFRLQLDASYSSDKCSISVFDAKGTKSSEFTALQHGDIIRLDGLAVGVYYVQIQVANKVRTQKVLLY